ncbi:hypothetical protein BD309DRAFT_951567, partial [Dichomitus squalens]
MPLLFPDRQWTIGPEYDRRHLSVMLHRRGRGTLCRTCVAALTGMTTGVARGCFSSISACPAGCSPPSRLHSRPATPSD